ncbi:MAG: FAD-dependent monooxygenase [Burkholderiaceae bacterium]
MTQIRTDIVVVGAGVAGLTAAASLAGAGFKVVLVHRGPAIAGLASAPLAGPFDPRVYAISPENAGLLRSVGAWQALVAARVAPVYDMRVFPRAGLAPGHVDELHLSAYEGRTESLAWIIEQDNLLRALAAAMPGRVRETTGEIAGIAWSQDGRSVTVDLEDGQRVRAALLVGADGARSAVRAHAGIAVQGDAYDHHAVVAHLHCEAGHRDTAWQWFGDHGVLALLPLPDSADVGPPAADPVSGRMVSIVWSTAPGRARSLVEGGAQALGEAVAEVAGGLLGEMRPISDPIAFPLARRWASSPIGERLVLIGDAAHVMHPLAGQGLNVGLGDVLDLTEVLAQARGRFSGSGFDPGQALLLRRHRRRRAEPVGSMLALTDGLQRLFGPATASPAALPLRAVRDAGWRLFARQALLRRQLTRAATRTR